MWDVVITIAGATVVVYGLTDIFLTLVHPHARGRLTRGIVAGIWNLTSLLGDARGRRPVRWRPSASSWRGPRSRRSAGR